MAFEIKSQTLIHAILSLLMLCFSNNYELFSLGFLLLLFPNEKRILMEKYSFPG